MLTFSFFPPPGSEEGRNFAGGATLRFPGKQTKLIPKTSRSFIKMFEVEFGERAVGCLINSGIWLSLGWKLDRFAEKELILNHFLFLGTVFRSKGPTCKKKREETRKGSFH